MLRGSLYLSVAGPGGLVESRPELHTELVMATRGCSWNPFGNKAVIRSWRIPHRTPRITPRPRESPGRMSPLPPIALQTYRPSSPRRFTRPPWTRAQRLRTVAQVQIESDLTQPVETPVYQSIATRAAAMCDRGVRVSAIAKHFGVDHHTVDKALRWSRSR